MVNVTKGQLKGLIRDALGVEYNPEDNHYIAPHIKEWGKTKKQGFFGMKTRYYIEDGADCDNRSLELRFMFKKRFFNKYIKKHGSKHGSTHYPDVFVEEIKVRFPNEPIPHWFVICLASTEEGEPRLIYRELTKSNIIIPRTYWDLIKIK